MAGRRRVKVARNAGTEPEDVPEDVQPANSVISMSNNQLIQAVQGAAPVNGPHRDVFASQNKAFSTLGGYEYHGDSGLVVAAEKWLRKCERVFDVLDL